MSRVQPHRSLLGFAPVAPLAHKYAPSETLIDFQRRQMLVAAYDNGVWWAEAGLDRAKGERQVFKSYREAWIAGYEKATGFVANLSLGALPTPSNRELSGSVGPSESVDSTAQPT